MELNIFGLSTGLILLLFSGAIVAGLVDALCGGGGLISIPVLLCAGLSPTQAIAANKLQGSVGALASTHYYWGKGLLEQKQLMILAIPALCGGVLGTFSLMLLGNAVMAKILPFMLLIMALYFLFAKELGDLERPPRLGILLFSSVIVPLIGFYDGFFGPGAGTFYLLAMTSLLGMRMVQGMAYARVLNLVSNLSALLLLIYLGKMAWLAGIIMALGESIGVYLGSHYAYQYGAKLIKPLVVIVCIVMAIKLIQ